MNFQDAQNLRKQRQSLSSHCMQLFMEQSLPKWITFSQKGWLSPQKRSCMHFFANCRELPVRTFGEKKSYSLMQTWGIKGRRKISKTTFRNTPRTTSVSKWDKTVWTKKNGYRNQMETRHLTLKYVPGCQVRWLRCTWLPGKGTQVRGRGREESETRRWLSHPRGRACCSREPCVQIYFENVLSIKMKGKNMLFNEHGARVQERILGRKMLYLCS